MLHVTLTIQIFPSQCLCFAYFYIQTCICLMFRDTASMHLQCPFLTGFLMQKKREKWTPASSEKDNLFPHFVSKARVHGNKLVPKWDWPWDKAPLGPLLGCCALLTSHTPHLSTHINTKALRWCRNILLTVYWHHYSCCKFKRTGRAYKHSKVPNPFLFSPLSFLSEGQLKGKERGLGNIQQHRPPSRSKFAEQPEPRVV